MPQRKKKTQPSSDYDMMAQSVQAQAPQLGVPKDEMAALLAGSGATEAGATPFGLMTLDRLLQMTTKSRDISLQDLINILRAQTSLPEVMAARQAPK